MPLTAMNVAQTAQKRLSLKLIILALLPWTQHLQLKAGINASWRQSISLSKCQPRSVLTDSIPPPRDYKVPVMISEEKDLWATSLPFAVPQFEPNNHINFQ
jgi:hypothetical protein